MVAPFPSPCGFWLRNRPVSFSVTLHDNSPHLVAHRVGVVRPPPHWRKTSSPARPYILALLADSLFLRAAAGLAAHRVGARSDRHQSADLDADIRARRDAPIGSLCDRFPFRYFSIDPLHCPLLDRPSL